MAAPNIPNPPAAGMPAAICPMHHNPDPLDPLLERWRARVPEQPESVASEVWRRIGHAETPATTPSWWLRLETAFGRPAFAAAFIAASIVLGLFLAELRVSKVQADRSARLQQEYLQLIDPLLTAGPDNPDVRAQAVVHRP